MRPLFSILAVAFKEFRVLVRDHTSVAAIIIQPVILTVIFGYAIRSEVHDAAWAVYDADRTELSRHLVDDLVATRKFAAPREVTGYQAVKVLFRRGQSATALVIPSGFARRIERGARAPLQLLLNGADPLVALRLSSVVHEVSGRFLARETARRADFTPHIPGEPTIALRRTMRFNPRLADMLFFVPTIPAILLTQFFFGIACFSIVGERERGTYEHLLALPLRPYEIVLGKALPYFVIGYGWFFVYYAVARVLFGIPVRGNMAVLVLATLLFMAASYAIAAFFSVMARNLHQAIYLTVFSVLPSTVISGFMVPTSTMPLAIQLAAWGLPATHYVTILRAIVVRGAGLSGLAAPLLSLLAILVSMLGLLFVFFPRRLGDGDHDGLPVPSWWRERRRHGHGWDEAAGHSFSVVARRPHVQ